MSKPKQITYRNSLGELITSECLAMFTHGGVDHFVVLNRRYDPFIITSESIEHSTW